MLIWLEGALNPNEICDCVVKDGDTEWGKRLIRFLDDAISNIIPEDPDPGLEIPSLIHYPCMVRGANLNESDANLCLKSQLKDVHLLAKECQMHSHTKTCYKYQKRGESAECHFGHDENNFCKTSEFDPDTAELCLCCLEGLVNNFNVTILEAIRCNMDIKFIGSRESAKAILYYITNYNTKSDLKTHIVFDTLELVVKKHGKFDPEADKVALRAKQMLQKCAYAMVSHQELSAQQVATYLVGGSNHYTSHWFQNLFWMSFKASVNNENPLPECYKKNTKPSEDAECQAQDDEGDSDDDNESTDDSSDVAVKGNDDESDFDDNNNNIHLGFCQDHSTLLVP